MNSKSDSAHKLLELNSLIEFSQLINSNLDLKFILGNILLSIMGKMLISKGMILIKRDSDTCDHLYTIESSKGVNLRGVTETMYEFPKLSFFDAGELGDADNIFIKNDIKYFFKIYFDTRLLGVLCLGSKLNKEKELTTSEIIFVETLLNLSASSIENTIKFNEISRLNNDLNGKFHQLKSLFELSKEFNTNFINRDKILRLLNYTLLGNFGIRDFIILSRYRSEAFHLLNTNKNVNIEGFDLSELQKITAPTVITQNSGLPFVNYLAGKGYELMVPTLNNGTVENIICIGKKLNKTGYTQSDIEFLESIINLSVISIENSILFQEYLIKEQIENELRIAREIQIALLPEKIPQVPGYDVAACNIPALHVGGDYYDVIKLCDTVYAFIIADVSGKGTPASLLMSNIQSSVHSYLKLYEEGMFDLSKATYKINELIYENTPPEKFITFFWGILDTKDNSFTYINAGHNHPLLYKNGEFHNLDRGGLMIGIMDIGVQYDLGQVTMDKGDTLVFYTDGVTEAQNLIKDEFGEERLIEIIKGGQQKTSKQLMDEINLKVDKFAHEAKQFDDITLIVLKRQV